MAWLSSFAICPGLCGCSACHHGKHGRPQWRRAWPIEAIFASGVARDGEAAVRPAECQMQTGGAALRSEAVGKVSIGKQMWLQCARRVTNSSYQPVILGGVDIADQPVKASVALGRPLSEQARQVCDCLKYIGPCITGTV